MSVGLPPGYQEGDEWICDCPGCSKEKHFYWNVIKLVGYCQVCQLSFGGRKKFREWFRLELDENAVRPYQATTFEDSILYHPELWTENAWDYPPFRNFLMLRGITEQVSRSIPIWHVPEERVMCIKADPTSPELPPCYLRRYGETGKWIPAREGLKLSRYGFGIEAWQHQLQLRQRIMMGGPRRIILVEGFFDVVSPGLIGTAVATFGTRVSDAWCAWLQQNVDAVMVMFDPEDETGAGQAAQRRLVERLRTWGVQSYPSFTYKDPKNLVMPSDLGYVDYLRRWVHGLV